MYQEAAFLSPVHQEKSNESEKDYAGMDMNVETCEVKQVDIVNLRNPELKLRILEQFVELLLVHGQLLN